PHWENDPGRLGAAPELLTDSLIMRDEHLDTILEKESDEFIKSSVENLVPSLSESKDLSDGECDLPLCDDSLRTNCDPGEEIRIIEKLLYDNSSPRPPEEFISKNSDAATKSFSPSPIRVEDSDSFRDEIDLSLTPDDSMPPGIEDDDYDSEGDILILENLLSNDSLSLPKNESFHFDIPSSPRPPVKPPDVGILDLMRQNKYKNETKGLKSSLRNSTSWWRIIEDLVKDYERLLMKIEDIRRSSLNLNDLFVLYLSSHVSL
nr:hypothetical protein [Tanacetum cinerariifolium]